MTVNRCPRCYRRISISLDIHEIVCPSGDFVQKANAKPEPKKKVYQRPAGRKSREDYEAERSTTPEEKRKKARLRAERYREAHREEVNSRARKYYEEHREQQIDRMRQRREHKRKVEP